MPPTKIFKRVLRSVKQRKNTKKIYGFDIETCDNNKTFLCASIWGDDYQNTYFNVNELVADLKSPRFYDCFIAASNLSFDFFGCFDGHFEMTKFSTLFRGSDLVFAKTYNGPLGFSRKRISKGKGQNFPLTFIDTYNYAKMSVKSLGKIIGVEKMDSPSFIGQHPKNKDEWDYLIEYNIRDSEVSARFIMFLFKSFEELGATPKLTIASTSMNLLKSKYLGDERYFGLPKAWLEDMLHAYYGGRTEVFGRGLVYSGKAYDYNSLYPSICVTAQFPDPNFTRVNEMNTTHYIKKYEGCALVDVECPPMQYPLLPFRYEGKTIFPTGTFQGWYTNIELREAIRLGYKIKKVYKNYWAQKTCNPLKNYMLDLYAKRKEYGKSPMEKVIKLLMNGLTGKFGQKFNGRDNWVSTGISLEELQKFKEVERIGDFFRVVQDSEPSSFCIPLWIAYITAIGRIKITGDASRYNAWYIDTDCIHTQSTTVLSSDVLGDFKHEYDITEGLYVRPKMYGCKVSNHCKGIDEIVKIKGLGTRMTYDVFKKKLFNPEIRDCNYVISQDYMKFTKFKEAKRRGLVVNEIVPITKSMLLDDSKRDWNDQIFDHKSFVWSTPLELKDGIPLRALKLLRRKALDAYKSRVKEDMREFLGSDLFDKESVGFDISSEEFLENEMFFAQHE